ncbi:hypothetical protein ABWK35_18465, partial [Bacillus safensis]|uniref:hypothetical protein n=1 Tax=Bacillus safensis TaxID=561879 RepID=UPI003394A914
QFVQEAALTVYTFEMLAISSLSLLIGHHIFACMFHVYKQVWARCINKKKLCFSLKNHERLTSKFTKRYSQGKGLIDQFPCLYYKDSFLDE